MVDSRLYVASAVVTCLRHENTRSLSGVFRSPAFGDPAPQERFWRLHSFLPTYEVGNWFENCTTSETVQYKFNSKCVQAIAPLKFICGERLFDRMPPWHSGLLQLEGPECKINLNWFQYVMIFFHFLPDICFFF